MIKTIRNNPHVSTIVPSLFRRVQKSPYKRIRFETRDKDFFDVDTIIQGSSSKAIVILHGLEGSSRQHYIQDHANKFLKEGFDVHALNFRSCSGEMNKTLRLYHSGDTGDLREYINMLLKDSKYDNINLLGFSLGGNVILKYLGEEGSDVSPKISKAYAVSVPIDLKSCAYQLASGFNKYYSLHFMGTLRKKVKQLGKNHDHDYLNSLKLRELKTFIDFDQKVTAPLNNYKNNEEYWERASSKQYLNKIKVSTKLINARNDPFLCKKSCFPSSAEVKNPFVELDYPEIGGHIGTISVI